MKSVIKLSSNMEDYLEAIAALKKEKGIARVKDISALLNVKKPSVAAALNNLSKGKLVIHERYGTVELTEEGMEIACNVQERHDVIYAFLTNILKVDAKTAEHEACGMEHSMSLSTLAKLNKFLKKNLG